MPSSNVYAATLVVMILVIIFAYHKYEGYSTEKMQGQKKSYTEKQVKEYLEGQQDPASIGLEQSIIDSHKQFTDEAYFHAQGANATDVIRDDTNDVNPQVGLRRIDYSGVFSGDDARVVSSEDPSQMVRRVGLFTI